MIALLIACGSTPSVAPPAPSPQTPAAAPAPAAASGVPDPLAGRSLAEVCTDEGLLLIQHDLDALIAGRFHEVCCVPGGLEGDAAISCELDWPFNDVPPCDAWDHMRNHIYARYGYPFTKPTYQQRFGSQPWYTRRDDFDASWMSEVARRNVKALEKKKADKAMCSD